ncbi:MAG: hypothetical protein IPK60_02185 [Sandaracinaceae bacterium]|nr:hypothetical protein [Sandaracinaceae bacterium]
MIIAIGVLSAVGLAVVVFAIAHAYGRRHDDEREREIWQAMAQSQGMELRQEKSHLSLHGTIGPLSFVVDRDTFLTYGLDAMLGLRATLPRPPQGQVVVWYAPDLATPQTVWPSLVEADPGAEWFARKFRVYASEPAIADKLLSGEVRERLGSLAGGALIVSPDEVLVLFSHLDAPSIKGAAQVVAALRDAQILGGR